MCKIEKTINNYLKISANLMYDKANELCGNEIFDNDCAWYHSAWQYLRLLNVVSTPVWHDEFYTKELQNSLDSGYNILISGTADYTMLVYVSEAIKKLNLKDTNIYVLDSCKSPLFCCKWYAEKTNIIINTVNEDILKYENEKFFDVICTDAFLTRFDKITVPKVIDKWRKLLKKDGKIITTVRIHDKNDLDSSNKEEAINHFIDTVRLKTVENQKYIKFSPEQMVNLAENYIKKMKSNNLGDEKDILNFFDKFSTKYNIKTVKGELKQTKYIELVAKKEI